MAGEKRTGFAEEGAKAQYDKLKNDRQPYETRAENCAAVTIPSLFPKDSDNSSTDYATPYQSVGSRCLNNLSAKLMLALFPQAPWMRLMVNEYEAKNLAGDEEAIAAVDSGLAMVERILMAYMEANNFRVTLFEAIKQLVVSGNALLYIPNPDGSDSNYNPMKLYRLTSYVVQRDSYGNVLQTITLDKIARGALPQDIKDKLGNDGESNPEEEVEVYTHVYLDEETGEYLKYEEIEGEEVEGTDATYPLDANPYIPVRMVRLEGEDYGRSYTEEYLGDLRSLEGITEAIVKMAFISSKVVGLVNPNGITQPRRLTKAKTGDYVPGRPDDIHYLQLEKQVDFSIAKQVADGIEERLGWAFLLNSAVQRNAERVTAEEIRYVAGELEATLGGVYSILSQELQLPIVRVLLSVLQATKEIPDLPKEAVEPTVATGLEALGRGQDLQKLTEAITMLGQMQPLAQDPDVDMNVLKTRVFNAMGIDTAGLMLSAEAKAKRQAEMAMETATQNGAAALGSGAGAAATSSPEAMQAAMDNAGVQMQGQ